MQQLLLGGSSFSQGGPGKGMYSRLNQNVLNRHYWVDLCQSFHDVFTDSGLFGIRIAVNPDQASRAASIMCAQLHALTGNMMSGITEEQLTRAKNMLKAFLVMGTEARMVAAEGQSADPTHLGVVADEWVDLGRQFLTQGFKESTELMCSKVDSVSKSVSRTILHRGCTLTLAGYIPRCY
jgi:processing peptidase subunit alpha